MEQLKQILERTQVIQATHFDPTWGQATLVIGLGARQTQSTDGACILNYKGPGAEGNPDAVVQFKSVSEYVARSSDQTWDRWRANLPLGLADIERIVVEDLSLDTCFALIIWVDRLGQPVLAPEKVDNWISYVTAWEGGYYRDAGGSPSASVACVASLLGHSYLNAKDIQPGLLACCEFLWTLMQSSDHPQKVIFDPSDMHYRRAMGRYAYEEAQHRLVVQNSAQCQLLIPTKSGSEKVLTDAIFLQESNPSAILKVLLRTDQQSSWTARGFAFLAMYRPAEKMHGNDITLSVDPDTNLTLEALWRDLEELENKRWGNSRPHGAPRHLEAYKTYAGPQTDQPWYDGGDWTLVAAPKSVTVNGAEVDGSKLTWVGDVLPLLWQRYSPIPEAAKVQPHIVGNSGKRFALVQWESGASLEIAESPTFLAWLASQSMAKEVKSPLDLPRAQTFEVLRLAGGLALVHRDGVTLFDNWDAIQLDVHGLKHETWAHVDARLAEYKAYVDNKSLERVQANQKKLLEEKQFHTQAYLEWSELVMKEKDKLTANLQTGFHGHESYDQARLREALERYWAVSDHRITALQALERIENATKETIAHMREKEGRLANSIVAGLGLGLLVKAALEVVKENITMNSYEWQLEVFKKGTEIKKLASIAEQVGHWESISLAAFVVFFCVGACLFWRKGTKLAAGGE